MFTMTAKRVWRYINTNVYHHHTHADRRSMGLLASATAPL
ncbi:hypothetical protein SAMN05443580_10653 [Variovorax sp. OV084]|nr:hypothetical protein SAMN05443580_10653 [Variovorax sp. OV084]